MPGTLPPALALTGSRELGLLHQPIKVTLSFQVTVCDIPGSLAVRIKCHDVYEMPSLGADTEMEPKTR